MIFNDISYNKIFFILYCILLTAVYIAKQWCLNEKMLFLLNRQQFCTAYREQICIMTH